MSGSNSEPLEACDVVEALPQRQPRAKRQRVNAGAIDTSAAHPDPDSNSAPDAGADRDSEAPADAAPASNQLTLQVYRSEPVPGYNFECEGW